MQSTNFDTPSLSMASSSSSLTTASSAPSSSSSPSSPATVKKSSTRSSMSSKKSIMSAEQKAQELFCYVGLLLILILVWPNDRSAFSTQSMTTTCSLSANNDGSDLCSSALADSIATPSSANSAADHHHPHRGKVIGANVKAADLAAAYQSIKSEYESLALNPTSSTTDDDWQLLSSHRDGSKVHMLEHPTDPNCPYIRMTSVMPGTMQQVWDFLDLKNWSTSMPKMDPFYENLTVLGQYQHSNLPMKLARKTTSRIVTFGKRDFTFVSVSDKRASRDGSKWVSGTVSVVTESIPPYQGYVRAYQDSIAFYERMDSDDRNGTPQMKLTIVFRLDLNDSRMGGGGGYIPMWIYVKTVGATGMASVQNMKRELESMAEERGRNDGGGGDEGGTLCDDKWWMRIRNGTKKCS